jgi:hypothetical protein
MSPATTSETAVHGDHEGGPAVPARRGRFLLVAVPPVLAFAVAHGVDYAAAAHAGFAAGFFGPGRWIHHDSHEYLAIAVQRYMLLRCHKRTIPPHSYCGDAGWLPLYPKLIGLFGRLGAPLPWAGKCLAEAFALGTYVLAWLLIGPYLPARAQTVLAGALVLTLVAASLTRWRASLTRTDWAVLCYTVLVWLFPLTQSIAVSRYRSEALLIAAVALVRRLPAAVQVPLVAAAACIAFGMADLFFQARLI